MAEVLPFRAVHYNLARVSGLDKVLTQPYDKISSEMQARYYELSPHNLVRIIRGRHRANDGAQENVYTRAAAHLREWMEQRVLVSEVEPALYPYHNRFALAGRGGTTLERRGFIALLRLQEYSAGVVHRHEETLSAPKADRLELLKATRAHFGQIFMLYSDPAGAIEGALETRDPVWQRLEDEYGTSHSVWRVTDPFVIEQVAEAMIDKPLVIADGHHRYETALAYRDLCRTENPGSGVRGSGLGTKNPGFGVWDAGLGINVRNPNPEIRTPRLSQPRAPSPEPRVSETRDERAEYVMVTLVRLETPGLTILPTHRVVHSLSGFDWQRFTTGSRAFFDWEDIQEPQTLGNRSALPTDSAGDWRRFVERLAEAGRQRPALGVYAGPGRLALLSLRKDADLARLLPDLAPRLRGLDVVILHRLLLDRVLGINPQAVREESNLRYVREPEAAIAEVDEGRAQICFLMNATPIRAVWENALAGVPMPQKSTDFYPKLLSGLTIYWLDNPAGI
jgi:uncharacterized protein (DUF1015 family)